MSGLSAHLEDNRSSGLESHASTSDNPRRFATLLLTIIVMTAVTWLCLWLQQLCVILADGNLTLRWPSVCCFCHVPPASYATCTTLSRTARGLLWDIVRA